MAQRTYTGWWILGVLLLVVGCDTLKDQPIPATPDAPVATQQVIALAEDGTGSVQLPTAVDLLGGAVTYHYTLPKHGHFDTPNPLTGKMVYRVGPTFRSTDTATYFLKRGNDSSEALIVITAGALCIPSAQDIPPNALVFTRTRGLDNGGFGANYPVNVNLSGYYTTCPGARLELVPDSLGSTGLFSIVNGKLKYQADVANLTTYTDFVRYRIVTPAGLVASAVANITIQAPTPCTSAIQAVDDTVNCRPDSNSRLYTGRISVRELLQNDITRCPGDSLDIASFTSPIGQRDWSYTLGEYICTTTIVPIGNQEFELRCTIRPRSIMTNPPPPNRLIPVDYQVFTRGPMQERKRSTARIFYRTRP